MGKKKEKKGKLPKEARHQAERAIAELKQPIVREMIAGAVGMAATALVKQAGAMRAAPKPAPSPAPHVEPQPEAAKPAGKSGGEQFAEIATGLAVAGLGKLFEKMQAASDAAKKPEPPKA